MTQPGLDLPCFTRQLQALTANEHALLVGGGIGSGKTRVGAMRALAAAYGRIGDAVVPTPNVGVVTAPTYPMLRDATIATVLEIAAPFIPKHGYNKTEHSITLRNGSLILFRSTDDPEHLRGPNALWWWGDEAALYQDTVYRIMLGRLRQFKMWGYHWLTTSPKGRNWLWKRFVQTPGSSSRLIKIPTWANPFISEEFYLSLVDEYQGDFAKQELDGEFVAFEGLIYPEFDRERHVRDLTAMPKVTELKEVAAGVDWGFNHPGVIVVGGKNGDKKFFELHEEYQRQRRIEDWVEIAKQLRDTWGIGRFYCDPSEPDYIRKFTEAGLKAVPADNSVNTGIQETKNLLALRPGPEGSLVSNFAVAPSCAYSISEFEQYQWAANKNGTLDQPLKTNDHAKDAERYLIMGLFHTPPQQTIAVETSGWAR